MSLLTQFYPGPGGGESTTGGKISGGSASILFEDSLSFGGNNGIKFTPSNTVGLTGPYLIGGKDAIAFILSQGPSSNAYAQSVGLMSSESIASDSRTMVFTNVSWGAYGNPTTGSILASSRLTTISGLVFNGNASWPSIGSTPSLTTMTSCSLLESFIANLSPNLTTLENVWLRGTAPGGQFRITNASLSATSVNNLLINAASYNTSPVVTTLDLTGGSSAGTSQLTAAGIAARNALQANSWTILLNP